MAEGGHLMRNLLAEFLRGFSLRTLIFLLDMVLPQLDAYSCRPLAAAPTTLDQR